MCTVLLPPGDNPIAFNKHIKYQMYQRVKAQWLPVINNSVVPYPMLQPTSGQQVPINYVSVSMQHHMIPPIHNYPSEDYTSQESQRITSTSEGEEETQNNNKNEWQMIRRTKRKKIHTTQRPRKKNRNT